MSSSSYHVRKTDPDSIKLFRCWLALRVTPCRQRSSIPGTRRRRSRSCCSWRRRSWRTRRGKGFFPSTATKSIWYTCSLQVLQELVKISCIIPHFCFALLLHLTIFNSSAMFFFVLFGLFSKLFYFLALVLMKLPSLRWSHHVVLLFLFSFDKQKFF